jgi:hypothetical protein
METSNNHITSCSSGFHNLSRLLQKKQKSRQIMPPLSKALCVRIVSMEEQDILYKNICSALIACTPEHWYSATLYLNKTNTGLEHLIESNEGHSDIASPDSELFATTRKLELFLNSKSEMFQKAKFSIWLNNSDQWQFKSEFEHENT